MRIRFFLILLLTGFGPFLSHTNAARITKIVVDAGHGGHDVGARGQFSAEKDLTLAISLKLGKIIRDSMRGVEVIYTRTTDDYPTLPERHEIANKAKADLFIAIHINSTPYHKNRIFEGYRMVKRGRKRLKQPVYRVTYDHVTQATGTESYVLGLHRNSQKENAIGEYNDSVSEEPGMLNENDPMTAIIVAQYAETYLKRSVDLGTFIQDEFVKQGRGSKGVMQKGLEVLAGSAMPGVLVECGFINNPEEEVYMNSEKGQFEIALAIFRGIRAYKWDVEKQ